MDNLTDQLTDRVSFPKKEKADLQKVTLLEISSCDKEYNVILRNALSEPEANSSKRKMPRHRLPQLPDIQSLVLQPLTFCLLLSGEMDYVLVAFTPEDAKKVRTGPMIVQCGSMKVVIDLIKEFEIWDADCERIPTAKCFIESQNPNKIEARFFLQHHPEEDAVTDLSSVSLLRFKVRDSRFERKRTWVELRKATMDSYLKAFRMPIFNTIPECNYKKKIYQIELLLGMCIGRPGAAYAPGDSIRIPFTGAYEEMISILCDSEEMKRSARESLRKCIRRPEDILSPDFRMWISGPPIPEGPEGQNGDTNGRILGGVINLSKRSRSIISQISPGYTIQEDEHFWDFITKPGGDWNKSNPVFRVACTIRGLVGPEMWPLLFSEKILAENGKNERVKRNGILYHLANAFSPRGEKPLMQTFCNWVILESIIFNRGLLSREWEMVENCYIYQLSKMRELNSRRGNESGFLSMKDFCVEYVPYIRSMSLAFKKAHFMTELETAQLTGLDSILENATEVLDYDTDDEENDVDSMEDTTIGINWKEEKLMTRLREATRAFQYVGEDSGADEIFCTSSTSWSCDLRTDYEGAKIDRLDLSLKKKSAHKKSKERLEIMEENSIRLSELIAGSLESVKGSDFSLSDSHDPIFTVLPRQGKRWKMHNMRRCRHRESLGGRRQMTLTSESWRRTHMGGALEVSMVAPTHQGVFLGFPRTRSEEMDRCNHGPKRKIEDIYGIDKSLTISPVNYTEEEREEIESNNDNLRTWKGILIPHGQTFNVVTRSDKLRRSKKIVVLQDILCPKYVSVGPRESSSLTSKWNKRIIGARLENVAQKIVSLLKSKRDKGERLARVMRDMPVYDILAIFVGTHLARQVHISLKNEKTFHQKIHSQIRKWTLKMRSLLTKPIKAMTITQAKDECILWAKKLRMSLINKLEQPTNGVMLLITDKSFRDCPVYLMRKSAANKVVFFFAAATDSETDFMAANRLFKMLSGHDILKGQSKFMKRIFYQKNNGKHYLNSVLKIDIRNEKRALGHLTPTKIEPMVMTLLQMSEVTDEIDEPSLLDKISRELIVSMRQRREEADMMVKIHSVRSETFDLHKDFLPPSISSLSASQVYKLFEESAIAQPMVVSVSESALTRLQSGQKIIITIHRSERSCKPFSSDVCILRSPTKAILACPEIVGAPVSDSPLAYEDGVFSMRGLAVNARCAEGVMVSPNRRIKPLTHWRATKIGEPIEIPTERQEETNCFKFKKIEKKETPD